MRRLLLVFLSLPAAPAAAAAPGLRHNRKLLQGPPEIARPGQETWQGASKDGGPNMDWKNPPDKQMYNAGYQGGLPVFQQAPSNFADGMAMGRMPFWERESTKEGWERERSVAKQQAQRSGGSAVNAQTAALTAPAAGGVPRNIVQQSLSTVQGGPAVASLGGGP